MAYLKHFKNLRFVLVWSTLLLIVAAAMIILARTSQGPQSTEGDIQFFGSEIIVQKNGDVLVTETIQIVDTIDHHGIIRRRPKQYLDAEGNARPLTYQIVSVTRDNHPESFFEASEEDEYLVYLGKPEELITAGMYTYVLQYIVKGCVNFQRDFDELTFAATGNWPRNILTTAIYIKLPQDIAPNELVYFGSVKVWDAELKVFSPAQGIDVASGFEMEEKRIRMIPAGSLKAHQEMLVQVRWPKGYVNLKEPS